MSNSETLMSPSPASAKRRTRVGPFGQLPGVGRRNGQLVRLFHVGQRRVLDAAGLVRIVAPEQLRAERRGQRAAAHVGTHGRHHVALRHVLPGQVHDRQRLLQLLVGVLKLLADRVFRLRVLDRDVDGNVIDRPARPEIARQLLAALDLVAVQPDVLHPDSLSHGTYSCIPSAGTGRPSRRLPPGFLRLGGS